MELHINPSLYLKELRQQKDYLRYYYELIRSKKIIHWLRYFGLIKSKKSTLDLRSEHFPYLRLVDDMVFEKHNLCFPNMRSFEYAMVEGALSTHMDRRIVTSTIIAEHYGITHHFPLTDPKLMRFFHYLPSHLKHRHGKGRYLMRQAMKSYLPASIVWRNDKAGATVPAAWNNYTQALPELFLERITPDHHGISADFVHLSHLTRTIEKNNNAPYSTGVIRLSLAVMMLAHLEKWLTDLFSK